MKKSPFANLQPPPRPVPAGWYSVRMVAQIEGISEVHAHKRLGRLLALGLVARQAWPNPAGKGAKIHIFQPKNLPGRSAKK